MCCYTCRDFIYTLPQVQFCDILVLEYALYLQLNCLLVLLHGIDAFLQFAIVQLQLLEIAAKVLELRFMWMM